MRAEDRRPLKRSGNILLRRLRAADQALVEPFAEAVAFERGEIVIRPGDPLAALYFPETAIFSLGEQVGRAGHIEVAVVGREGMLGWPALLGCQRTSHGAIAQLHSGSAIRIAVEPLMLACAKSGTLWDELLQFVHLVIVQMARSIASHLYDSLDLRLARWLLMRHDRLQGDVLFIRHDEIAQSLNVRRASITDGMHLLEGAKFVRCNRGKIAIRDRPLLEAFAGDAYGSPEALYRDLIAPFGKSISPSRMI